MNAAHLAILAAAAVAAVAWVLWARHRPRIRRAKADECQCGPFPCIGDWPDTDGRVRAADEDEWQDQALDVVTERDRAKAEHMNRTLRRITEED